MSKTTGASDEEQLNLDIRLRAIEIVLQQTLHVSLAASKVENPADIVAKMRELAKDHYTKLDLKGVSPDLADRVTDALQKNVDLLLSRVEKDFRDPST